MDVAGQILCFRIGSSSYQQQCHSYSPYAIAAYLRNRIRIYKRALVLLMCDIIYKSIQYCTISTTLCVNKLNIGNCLMFRDLAIMNSMFDLYQFAQFRIKIAAVRKIGSKEKTCATKENSTCAT